MSLRKKLIVSFAVVCLLAVSLLALNSVMARQEERYVAKLLAIHHQYAALLNLKNAVSRQLSEAQDIFLYGKTVDGANFTQITAQVGKEVRSLSQALDEADALSLALSGEGPEPGRQRIVRLQHDYEDLYRELMLMSTLFQSGRRVKAQEHFQTEIVGRFSRLFAQIDSWLAVQKEAMARTESGFVALNRRHKRTSLVALAAIVGIVLFSSGAFVYLLGPRLKELMRGTERISQGDFSKPVLVEGNDEFTRLSLAMNQMMADLASSRKKLLEQSYYSGMADMVSGALHNLRNALAPIVIELEGQQQTVMDLRLEQMSQACAELKSPGLPPDRRQDLVEYLALGLERMGGRLTAMAETMANTRNKVGVVEKVLNQQSHLARMERPLEPINLAEVAHDSLGLVRQELLARFPVLIDPSLGEVGPLVSQRIVLVQVVANLIGNGLEAIARSGAATGQVRVRADREEEGQVRQVHVRVMDTGEGIVPEMRERIFERGVSGKEGGSGLGLHWCANATASLGGRLYAESPGPGLGATLHLVLKAEVDASRPPTTPTPAAGATNGEAARA